MTAVYTKSELGHKTWSLEDDAVFVTDASKKILHFEKVVPSSKRIEVPLVSSS